MLLYKNENKKTKNSKKKIVLNKKLLYSIIGLTALMLFVLFVPIDFSMRAEAATDTPLYGYAWSSNIGWVSFSSQNCDAVDNVTDVAPPDGFSDGDGLPVVDGGDGVGVGRVGCPHSDVAVSAYGVFKDDATGELAGYAWSPSIGWVYFGPDGNGIVIADDAPTGSEPRYWAKIDSATGIVKGWAKALTGGSVGSGDWDGWIKMSKHTDDAGPIYNVLVDSDGNFSGFAWGDDVVGWLSFEGVNYNVNTTEPPPPGGNCCGPGGGGGSTPSVGLYSDSSVIDLGGTLTLTWQTANEDLISSCIGSGDWNGAKDKTGGSEPILIDVVDPNPRTYKITCNIVAGDKVEDEISVTVLVDFILDNSSNLFATMIGEAGNIASSNTEILVLASSAFKSDGEDVEVEVTDVKRQSDGESVFGVFDPGNFSFKDSDGNENNILVKGEYINGLGRAFSVNVPAGLGQGIYEVYITGTSSVTGKTDTRIILLNVVEVTPKFKEI